MAARYGAPLSGYGPEAEGFREYAAKGTLHAFQYEGPPAKFATSWGKDMIVNPGDYIATTEIGSNHFHRIERDIFLETYVEADG
jgi:hypothetical protein